MGSKKFKRGFNSNPDTFKVHTSIVDKNSGFGAEKHLDILIEINGVYIPHYVDWYNLLINQWSSYERFRGHYYSEFYPFNCSCDEPGCVGIFNGIFIKHRKNTIEWRLNKEDGYGFLEKTFYEFRRVSYDAELAKVWCFIHENKDAYDSPWFKLKDSMSVLMADPLLSSRVNALDTLKRKLIS